MRPQRSGAATAAAAASCRLFDQHAGLADQSQGGSRVLNRDGAQLTCGSIRQPANSLCLGTAAQRAPMANGAPSWAVSTANVYGADWRWAPAEDAAKLEGAR